MLGKLTTSPAPSLEGQINISPPLSLRWKEQTVFSSQPWGCGDLAFRKPRTSGLTFWDFLWFSTEPKDLGFFHIKTIQVQSPGFLMFLTHKDGGKAGWHYAKYTDGCIALSPSGAHTFLVGVWLFSGWFSLLRRKLATSICEALRWGI